MLSSSSLSKIKRYLPEMVGEKRGKWACLLYFDFLKIQSITLEHDTFIHLGWEILCLTVNQTSLKVFIRFLGISFGSIVAKPSAVSLCVQEDSSNKPFIYKISVIHFDHPWVSHCQYIFKTWSMILCCGLAYDRLLSIDENSLSGKLI